MADQDEQNVDQLEEFTKTGRKKKGTFDYKKWYAENRAAINAARRETYHSNPKYREKVKERAQRTYHERHRKPVPIDRRSVISTTGDRFFSIGRVARVIGRQIPTIRQYHLTGTLPQPTHTDSRGWRLYSQQQVTAMRHAFDALDDPANTTITSLKDVKAYVEERWNG